MIFPSAQISFGTGSLLGYTPWHSVDQVHIVAAAEPPSESGEKSKLQQQQLAVKRLVGTLSAKAVFGGTDADGSGGVDKAELKAALKAHANVTVEGSDLDELFALMDTDGSGEIDAREFEAAFYAARLEGGVDIYIPMTAGSRAEIPKLESPEFKKSMLYGWRPELELV